MRRICRRRSAAKRDADVSPVTAKLHAVYCNADRERRTAAEQEAVMTQANLYKFIEDEKNKKQDDDAEERRERGNAFVIAGWIFLLFGVMVALFFHPSSPRYGNVNIRNLALGLAAVGIALKLWGNKIRRSAPSKY